MHPELRQCVPAIHHRCSCGVCGRHGVDVWFCPIPCTMVAPRHEPLPPTPTKGHPLGPARIERTGRLCAVLGMTSLPPLLPPRRGGRR
eukprot:scaffold1771_cov343-Pavlova_lutheri.AAC.1